MVKFFSTFLNNATYGSFGFYIKLVLLRFLLSSWNVFTDYVNKRIWCSRILSLPEDQIEHTSHSWSQMLSTKLCLVDFQWAIKDLNKSIVHHMCSEVHKANQWPFFYFLHVHTLRGNCNKWLSMMKLCKRFGFTET